MLLYVMLLNQFIVCYYVIIYFQSQEQIVQAVCKVDVEEDVQNLLDETGVTSADNQAEFLMADYYVRISQTDRQTYVQTQDIY